MRRILAVATLGVALFSAAACAESNPTASPTGAAATTAAASVDKKTACTALLKASADFKTQAIALMPRMLEAASDPAKAQAVSADLLKALKDFGTAYGADAAAIADPELKMAVEADLKALNTAITAVTAAGADVTKIDAALSQQDFENAGEAVERLCKA